MSAANTAFASDFDGTLCTSDWDAGTERFEEQNLAAVRRYQAAGGFFGICTGRPGSSVANSLHGILKPDFYIVATGAQVLDRSLRPLFEQTISRDVAQELYERYATDEMLFVAMSKDDFVSVGRQLAPGIPVVSTLDELPGELLGVSLECHGNEPAARAAKEDINERYAGVVEGFQNLGSVDVVAAGCSKGSGIRLVRELLGVRSIAGIGDSFNDLAMLEAADVAYTFDSSPLEVQRAADVVVGSLAQAVTDFMAR